MNLDQAPDVMKVPEVAVVLRCSDKMVYQLISSGQLEAISLGSGYRVAKHALRAFLHISEDPDPYTGLRVVGRGSP